jgi:hypothetical protein
MHNWTEPQPSPAPTEAGRCTSTSICRFRVPSCSCRHDCLSGEWVLQLVKMENAVFLLWFYYSIGIIKLKPCHVVPSAHPDLQVQSGLIWCSYCYSHSLTTAEATHMFHTTRNEKLSAQALLHTSVLDGILLHCFLSTPRPGCAFVVSNRSVNSCAPIWCYFFCQIWLTIHLTWIFFFTDSTQAPLYVSSMFIKWCGTCLKCLIDDSCKLVTSTPSFKEVV